MKNSSRKKIIKADNLPDELNHQSEDLQRQENISFLASLDTAFPLSGGEPDIDLFSSEEDDFTFQRKLNTTYPLSGGETDEDLRHALEDENTETDADASPKRLNPASDRTANKNSPQNEKNETDDWHVET